MTDLVNAARVALYGVSPGPWFYDQDREVRTFRAEGDRHGPVSNVICSVHFDTDHLGNARFIAAARELVPAMAKRIEALERELSITKGEPK